MDDLIMVNNIIIQIELLMYENVKIISAAVNMVIYKSCATITAIFVLDYVHMFVLY